jgi:predicted transcriptional regulator
MDNNAKAITEHTADIVSAYVGQNTILPDALPSLIQSVYAALSNLSGEAQEPVAEEEQKPFVPIKKSITPDFLISLESGRKLKSLKRYLITKYGMTPDDYRRKWNLPRDYPMVAPAYAAQRSALAKASGLGFVGGRGNKPETKTPAKRGPKPKTSEPAE